MTLARRKNWSDPDEFLRSPWFYPYGVFVFFLIANGLLSYFSLGVIPRLWIFLVGILLPMAAVLAHFSSKKSLRDLPAPLRGGKDDLPFSWTVVLAVLVLTVLFRLYRLDSLSAWPRVDEGTGAYLLLDNLRHWKWTLSLGNDGAPPLYYWGLAGFFKWFGVSLTSLWVFPALVSLLTLPLTYGVARNRFSPFFSAWIAFFLASSFWAAYGARFSESPVLLIPVECLSFGMLSRFLSARTDREKFWAGLGLGIVVGIGFYVYFPFAMVAAAVCFGLMPDLGKKSSGSWKARLAFLLILGVVLLPLALSLLRGRSGGYYLSWIGGAEGGALWRQAVLSLSYLSGIFWGTIVEGDYGPVWGGFFNPIESTFFFMGLIELFRRRQLRSSQWLGIALLLTLVPGVVTHSVEFFRIIGFLPLGIWVIAWGACVPFPWKGLSRPFLFSLLVLSAALNGWHLFRKYPEAWAAPGARWAVNIKSIEYYGAYQVLRDLAAREGPGAVLEEFQPDNYDRSLTIAIYSFNTAENPAYGFADSKWVAVLTNVHYGPFLLKRFPRSRVFPLPHEPSVQYGGDVLWVVPVDSSDRAVLGKWFEADQALKRASRDMVERRFRGSRDRILADLAACLDLMRDDPFLWTLYWDKRHVQEDLQAAYGDVPMDRIYGQSLFCLRQALAKGYPAAHLYNELGTFLELGGDWKGAAVAFRAALRAPPTRCPPGTISRGWNRT